MRLIGKKKVCRFINRIEIRQKESILFKEKDKLESHIKTFKLQKAEFDLKNNNFLKHYNKHLNQVNKLQNEKIIFNHDKEIFYNLNMMINGGIMFNNEDKPDHGGNISLNNLTLPTTAVSYSTNSINMNNIKSIKSSIELRKEVMSEIPRGHSKRCLTIERESFELRKSDDIYNSYRDKDTRNSMKIPSLQNDSYHSISNVN
jgi:hypothetical protein